MAGAAVEVHISRAAIDARPAPWNLTTPESTVRSYLAWTNYAYRIAQSDAASATMSADRAVYVDSYIQLNLEKSQLIDQTLKSVTFGKTTVEGTHTIVPTHEVWSYRYLSIKTTDQVLRGPFTATYDVTYSLKKSGAGWVVDSVKFKAIGEVK